MHYVDTSVLTGCYCPEARSERAQRALSAIAEPAISPLVEVEFHCAVARKVRSGAMDRSAAARVFSEFQLHLAEPRFRILEVRRADYTLAREWIARMATPLRVLDAIHLAVAYSNGLPLITADAVLAEAARHFGVKHKLIA
jgi:hypothetical protein